MAATILVALDPADPSTWVVTSTYRDPKEDLAKVHAGDPHDCWPMWAIKAHPTLSRKLQQIQFVVLELVDNYISPQDLKKQVESWSSQSALVQAAIKAQQFPTNPPAANVPQAVRPPKRAPKGPKAVRNPKPVAPNRKTLAGMFFKNLTAEDIAFLTTEILRVNPSISLQDVREAFRKLRLQNTGDAA